MQCLGLLLMLLLTLTSSHVLGGFRNTNRNWKDDPTSTINKLMIRGVPASKAALYNPEKHEFECLDGSNKIIFNKINDDYCDCDDGSDEPGTAACPNGHFYCRNNGYKGYFVPSGWVNDGVCDCCDGSDEYMSDTIICKDNCNELAQIELEQSENNAKLYKEGGKIRDELCEKGKLIKTENQEKLIKLRTDLAEAERTKKERENVKLVTEDREKKALEKYQPPAPEQAPAESESTLETDEQGDLKKEDEIKQESENIAQHEAEEYFKHLDSNNDGLLTISELQTRAMFDKNHDGEVSREEAMYWLDNKEQVNQDMFFNIAWPHIKRLIMKNAGIFKPSHVEGEEKTEQNSSTEDFHEDEEPYKDEKDEGMIADTNSNEEFTEEEEEAENERNEDVPQKEEEKQIEYDEETLAIIEEAKEAREKYQESERAVIDLTNEIRQYEERIERDYGPNDEYASLDGQCFEYETKEYIYSLCLFDKASQRSISGGSEVGLGQWNSWIGGEEDHKYTKAKYDRGITCWNGPPRSTIVSFLCGTENKILSVSEPNICEYAMELSTPAACNPKIFEKKYDFHDSSTWKDNHDEL